MSNSRPLLKISVLFCIVLFAVGVVRLFWLRFEAGDLYPPYSSLRSDPLGVQVLYEGLQALGDQEISRNFLPPAQMSPAPGATFLFFGLTGIPEATTDPWETILEKISGDGGRLVVTLTARASARDKEEEEGDTGTDNAGNPDENAPEETPAETPALGVTLHSRSLDEDHGDVAVGRSRRGDDPLPETLVFRSSLFFEPDDPAWETVFSFENEPVVVRRAWGKGEVVMIADSYLFSNEALRNHRSPDFLAWAIPSDSPAVFDEYHHGLTRQPGISALMRKYRLHGVVLSLAVVVVLLIWQRAVVFAPRQAVGPGDGPTAAGSDATDGWVALMRRHIPRGNLLAVCFKTWESSAAADRFSKEQVGQVRDMIAQPGENPVTVYQSICEFLKRGKTP